MDKEKTENKEKIVPVQLDTLTLNDAVRMIQKLNNELNLFKSEFYSNNFTANQTFNKYSSFTTRLKVPSYSTLPATCEVGEVVESAGKLRICSATNTWTVVGAQTA